MRVLHDPSAEALLSGRLRGMRCLRAKLRFYVRRQWLGPSAVPVSSGIAPKVQDELRLTRSGHWERCVAVEPI